MIQEWQEKPTTVDYFTDEIQFVMAVDESGVTHVCKGKDDWLSIVGVLVNIENYQEAQEKLMGIKNKYWENGCFYDKRVVFHYRDIKKRQSAFSKNGLTNYIAFQKELLEFLGNMNMTVISSSIDKEKLHCQYYNPYDTYEIAVEFLIERYLFFLERNNSSGIIVFESRGRKEDRKILNLINNLFENGNQYIRGCRFKKRIKGVYFNKKQTKDGKKSYWLLEISDICSNAIYLYLKNKDKSLFEKIEGKLLGYPEYKGKGMKKFPK